MIATLNASSETDPAQKTYRWPLRRRNYGATRVFTIANAVPTGQWLSWAHVHPRPPSWARNVKSYALLTQFVLIAITFQAWFWQQLLTARPYSRSPTFRLASFHRVQGDSLQWHAVGRSRDPWGRNAICRYWQRTCSYAVEVGLRSE